MSTRRELFKTSVLSAFALMAGSCLVKAQGTASNQPILIYGTSNGSAVQLLLVKIDPSDPMSAYYAFKAAATEPLPHSAGPQPLPTMIVQVQVGNKSVPLHITNGIVNDPVEVQNLKAIPMQWVETGFRGPTVRK